MKCAVYLILVFGISAGKAFAAGELANEAMTIGERLMSVESQLQRDDYRYVARALDSVAQILQRYGNGGGRMVCVSNGESGAFERFTPYFNGQTLGGGTSKAYCLQLIQNLNAGLICLSNGENGAFERFNVFDYQYGKELGGGTALSTCLELVNAARGGFVCVSNGENGAFEKFQLFDRSTNKEVGGETSKANCLETLP